MFLSPFFLWFATKNVQSVCFFCSLVRGDVCGAERISIIWQEERECLLSDSGPESVNTKRRSEAEIDKCLPLFWHWAFSHFWCPTLQPVQRMWRLTNILTQGLRHYLLLLATSRLTSWRMTWEHWRPAALTNDFDGTQDKMFPVWRLKQFICFIDLQYKGKEIIEH